MNDLFAYCEDLGRKARVAARLLAIERSAKRTAGCT
jgi:hypothetical protein